MTEHRETLPAPRSSRWRAGALAFCLLATLPGGCNWMTPRHPKQLRQGLMIHCNRPKAVLYVNERIVGTLDPKAGTRIGLMPGTYRLAVKLPGYFTRYLDVRVVKDNFQKLDVVLRPELD